MTRLATSTCSDVYNEVSLCEFVSALVEDECVRKEKGGGVGRGA